MTTLKFDAKLTATVDLLQARLGCIDRVDVVKRAIGLLLVASEVAEDGVLIINRNNGQIVRLQVGNAGRGIIFEGE